MEFDLKKNNNTIKKINYPIAGFIAVILIGSITLFCSPAVGMSDNGDFYRVISSNGLYELDANESNSYSAYFNRYYGIYRYNNDIKVNFTSTQEIFIKAAVCLNKIFYKNYIFDIRFMSWMFLLAEAVGIYLIIKVLINRINEEKYKIIITLVIIFIFCDTGYLAYYNSFYGEAVNLSFFLLSIGILLNIIEFKKYNKWSISMFGISSFIFFGSKEQFAPVGILIGVLLLRIGIKNKDKILKIITFAFAIGFVLSSVLFYRGISEDFKYINAYNAMNRGILLYEDDPDEVMKYFNLNTQYSLLKDTTFYDEITLVNLRDKEFMETYYKSVTPSKIAYYYATHLKTFIKMMKVAIRNSYSIRPKAMGNYEKIENKYVGAKSYFFALYSTIKEKIFSGNLIFSLGAMIVYGCTAITRYIKGVKNTDYEMIFIEEAYIYVFLIGFSQIVISVIGAGDADLAKHVFMYNISFDLILIHFISIKLQKHEMKKVNLDT